MRTSLALVCATVLPVVGVGYLGTEAAHAAVTITVTGSSGGFNIDGTCDLREAVQATNTNTLVDSCNGVGGDANDIITIATTGTILLTGGPLLISQGVTINGPGANLLAIDGQGTIQVIRAFAPNDTTTITGLTVQHGYSDETSLGGDGGAVRTMGNLVLDRVAIIDSVVGTATCSGCGGSGLFIQDPASLTMTNSTVSGNLVRGDSGWGAGILMTGSGVASLTNVTISGNVVNGSMSAGGGMANQGIANQGVANLNNVTIAGNSAGRAGGLLAEAPVNIANSIVANNIATNAPTSDCWTNGSSAVINSQDYNLIGVPNFCGIVGATTHDITGVDPALGPLADNGGPTKTRALGAGSAAIDKGNDATCATSDQRGTARPQDGDGAGGAQCDIGAFELLAAVVPPTTTTTTISTIAPDSTTTTSVAAGTTTTSPVTTAAVTTAAVTTTAPKTATTVSVAAVGTLPLTGSNNAIGAGIAVMLLVIGITLVAINRRSRLASAT